MQFVNAVSGAAMHAVRGRAWIPVGTICAALLPDALLAQAVSDDPWEGINRPVYAINRIFDDYVVRPVAVIYDNFMPGFAKLGVHNFFNNLDDVNVVANDVFQLKMRAALNDSGRLLLNTTAGLGGLLDVASEIGLYKNYEDFGQTLGYWGVGDGGYLVLPLLGASTLRDTAGYVPDLLLSPVSWIPDRARRRVLYVSDTVDTRVTLLVAETLIRGDEYQFVRDAYFQRREYLVNDGLVQDEFDDY